MTSNTTTIAIPRLPDESPRAYAARVAYITAGPQRSLGKLRGQSGGKAGVPRRLSTLEGWSARHAWTDHARRYDDAVAALAAQRAAAQHLADLEDHRARYQKAGRDLYTVAAGLLAQCARAVRGQVIRGADGTEHTIPAMELTPTTLATAMRALAVAADLEAHALGLDRLAQETGDD